MLPVFLLRAQRGSSQVRCSAGLRVHPIIRGRGPGVPVPPLEPEGAGPGRGRPAGLRARLGFLVSSLRCLCFNSKGLSGPGDPVEPPEGPHPNLSFPKPRSDTERPAARAPLRPRMETRPRSSCWVRGHPQRRRTAPPAVDFRFTGCPLRTHHALLHKTHLIKSASPRCKLRNKHSRENVKCRPERKAEKSISGILR